MNIIKKIVLLFIFLGGIFYGQNASAHEPLYGFGPHVLFLGGFAPHYTLHVGPHVEHEYALGYGITKNWTVVGEVPFHSDHGYEFAGFKLKQKYRLYSEFEPGSSYQISAISELNFPAEEGHPTVANFGITGGQEALRWYWFYAGGYGFKFSDQQIQPGNHVFYNATVGYRPLKTDYEKPDLVLFLEGIGRFQQKSLDGDETVTQSGGHSWAVAPSFFLTYKNIALRGGVQFGLGDSGYIDAPGTNYKLTVELHI